MSVSRRLRCLAAGAIVAGLAGGLSGFGAQAAEDPSAGRAMNTRDLVADERCGVGALRLAGVAGVRCTHGPDAAPQGVETGRSRTTTELFEQAPSSSSSVGTVEATGPVPCYGDGASGKRVQVIYARSADVADRFPQISSLLTKYTAAADAVFADSAKETGGVRHVRWVTDTSCNLLIHRVQLTSTGDDTMSNTINELRSAGFNRNDRKYLVFMDAYAYCGISELHSDDSAGLSNVNNTTSAIARVDNICWGLAEPVEAHELMHALGGIQFSAPHANGGGHCTDESDRMCYDDGSGRAMTTVCAASHERLFDCNHDDYYSTAPAPGSYLATHWNTASSEFLAQTEPTTAASTATAAPVTETFTGSVSRKAPTASHVVQSGAGDLTTSMQFDRRATLTMSIVRSDGTTVAMITGSSSLRLTASVPAGTYTIAVRTSGASASYTLSATHAR